MQIDATIIIGIIILMTFQSFSSNAYEKQYGEIISEYRQEYAQYYATNELFKKCEAKDSPRCIELARDLEEIELRKKGTEEWVNSTGIAKSFDEFFSNVTFFSIGGSMIANIVNLAMVLPFASSAIIESVRVLKGNKDSDASREGIVAMMVGFGMIIVGFVIVILLMVCATFVTLDCFGVNQIFSITELPTNLKP